MTLASFGASDRGAIVHKIERQMLVERGVDGVVRGNEADGVTIERR